MSEQVKYVDKNGLSYFKSKTDEIYVAKEAGKGLSTNDFNNDYKSTLDNLNIPTKTSDLTNDSGYISQETDPTVPSYVKNIAQQDITNWNNKSNFSGDYNDLTNKPTIPDVSTLQPLIDTTHKLSSDLVDDTNNTNKFVTTAEKTTWNAKQDEITSGNKLSSDLVSGLSSVATSGSYTDLTDKPTIPSEVTESTVSGWGFTKNTGDYSKPSGGIPSTDLDSAVQTSLGKADTALQAEQYTGTITGITMNGVSKGTSGVVDLGTVITQHQDITGKENVTNKVTSLSAQSTDTQYPSAKCVYDLVGDVESVLTTLTTGNGV